jgi:uncharacterized damage-inducible protein DinB
MLPDLESLFAKLQVERDNVTGLVAGLEAAQLDRPGPGGCWSIRQTLTHIVASEPGILSMARNTLAGGADLPAGLDIHETNQREVSLRAGRSVAELLAEWQERREEWRPFLESLSPEQLEMQGPHPVFPQLVNLRQLVIVMLKHERSHRQEIVDMLAQA